MKKADGKPPSDDAALDPENPAPQPRSEALDIELAALDAMEPAPPRTDTVPDAVRSKPPRRPADP